MADCSSQEMLSQWRARRCRHQERPSMRDMSHLIDLLAELLGTVTERRALLREALGMRSPLLNAIEWDSTPLQFVVNPLATLAHNTTALDAVIDVAKERSGPDVADALEALRPDLHAWANAGADTTAFALSVDITAPVF